jgi:LmbE family N-acetylglucosaminyl deacetylase
MTAFRPVPGTGVRALYAYEVASSTEWAFGKFAPVFVPETFVDIGAFLELKLKAIATYASELREFPHPRSARAMRVQAEERGVRIGVAAAEAFATIWRLV